MRNTIIGLLASGAVSLVAIQTTPVKNTWSVIREFVQDSTKHKNTVRQVRINSNGKHTTTFSDDRTREEITYEGTIRISKDFTDIESISPNGSLTYVNTTNDGTRRFEIKSDKAGKLTRTYKENGKVMPYESAGRPYLAKLMPGLMAVTGIGIEDYIGSIYKESGIDGVFRQADRLSGTYVKVSFVKEVLEQPGLKAAEIGRVLEYVNPITDSDYDRRSILTAIPERYFNDEVLVDNYLDVAQKIGSDYESRLALQHLLKATAISKSNLGKVIAQIGNIGSDYEKSNVLAELMSRQDFLPDHYSGTLKAIAGIGSDYEKGKTLGRLIKQHQLSAGQYEELFPVIRTVGSDYEKGKVLKGLAPSIPSGAAALREAYQKTANSIGSDYERRQALDALK